MLTAEADAGTVAQIEGPGGAAPALSGPDQPKSKTEQMIEVAKVAGSVQASAVREVGDIVRNNPHEALAVVRQWINEPV